MALYLIVRCFSVNLLVFNIIVNMWASLTKTQHYDYSRASALSLDSVSSAPSQFQLQTFSPPPSTIYHSPPQHVVHSHRSRGGQRTRYCLAGLLLILIVAAVVLGIFYLRKGNDGKRKFVWTCGPVWAIWAIFHKHSVIRIFLRLSS